MTKGQSFSDVLCRFLAYCPIAALLTLAGCSHPTYPSSPEKREIQQAGFEKEVDQASVSKTGRRSSKPIVTKSIKSRLKNLQDQ
jgi:hypothetical protein